MVTQRRSLNREVEGVVTLAFDYRQARLFACGCCRRVWDLLPPGPGRQLVEVAESVADGARPESDLHAAFLAAGGSEYLEDDVERSTRDLYLRAFDGLMMWWDSWLDLVAPLFVAAPTSHQCALVACGCLHWVAAARGEAAVPPEDATQVRLAHDIAGPLVCPVDRLRHPWRTRQVYELSRRMYHTGNFTLIPQLAAALQDAGCDDGELLDRCRAFRPVAIDPAWRTEAVVGLAAAMYASGGFTPMPILADALEEAGCDDSRILDHCREPGEHVRGCWVVDRLLGRK
ncbi:MAG: hypothetical protein U0871_15165 [Gemmataceae bacterium]